jgi:hypothetical protein
VTSFSPLCVVLEAPTSPIATNLIICSKKAGSKYGVGAIVGAFSGGLFVCSYSSDTRNSDASARQEVESS